MLFTQVQPETTLVKQTIVELDRMMKGLILQISS